MRVIGQVAAITGGARGIGLATAAALSRAGMCVAIGDIDGDAAAAAAEQLGDGVIGLRVDVADPASFETFLDDVEAQLGPLDVLVNNAGIVRLGPFLEETPEQTRRQVDVNLHGVINGTRLALQRMVPRRQGHIVNVASLAGKAATPPHQATYAATKHAVVGLTESVRREHLDSGVQFSIVIPGVIATEMIAGYGSARGVGVLPPEDVADAIVAALRRRRVNVWVPRSLALLHLATALLPRGARDLLARVLRADDVTLRADPAARAAYDARITANPTNPNVSAASE